MQGANANENMPDKNYMLRFARGISSHSSCFRPYNRIIEATSDTVGDDTTQNLLTKVTCAALPNRRTITTHLKSKQLLPLSIVKTTCLNDAFNK